jgi:hypothetical protein
MPLQILLGSGAQQLVEGFLKSLDAISTSVCAGLIGSANVGMELPNVGAELLDLLLDPSGEIVMHPGRPFGL